MRTHPAGAVSSRIRAYHVANGDEERPCQLELPADARLGLGSCEHPRRPAVPERTEVRAHKSTAGCRPAITPRPGGRQSQVGL